MDVTKTAVRTMGLLFATLLVVPIATALIVWFLDGLPEGVTRPGFADARIISVRYIASVVVFLLMLIPFFVVAKRRPPGTPLSWGEAMVAAVYVFFVMFWIYGVVPHEFLTWADSELGWRADKKIIGPESAWTFWSLLQKFPITITKETVRDLIAVHLYVVGLGGLIWAAAFWNDRAKKAAAAAAIEPVSTYGRPLVARAGRS